MFSVVYFLRKHKIYILMVLNTYAKRELSTSEMISGNCQCATSLIIAIDRIGSTFTSTFYQV